MLLRRKTPAAGVSEQKVAVVVEGEMAYRTRDQEEFKARGLFSFLLYISRKSSMIFLNTVIINE